jgi:hypothetical protein
MILKATADSYFVFRISYCVLRKSNGNDAVHHEGHEGREEKQRTEG